MRLRWPLNTIKMIAKLNLLLFCLCKTEKRSVTMTRRDLSHNVLEVAHTGGVERWLVVKKMLYPKKASCGSMTHSW